MIEYMSIQIPSDSREVKIIILTSEEFLRKKTALWFLSYLTMVGIIRLDFNYLTLNSKPIVVNKYFKTSSQPEDILGEVFI